MIESWRSRLARADEHVEEVQREIEEFIGRNPYRVVGKLQPHPFIPKMINYIVKGEQVEAPPARLGDVIGDAVENLRSCLDLIAYRLAGHVGEPPRGTEFPVFWSPDNYRAVHPNGAPKAGSGLYKVRGMPSAAQAVIQGLQPYNGVDPADFMTAGPNVVPETIILKPLYLIHALRQINFHREPHLTGAIASGFGTGINTLRDLDIVYNPSGSEIRVGAFEPDTTLAILRFTITGPNPVVEMNFHPTFDVAFEPKGPARGQPVVPTLRSLRDDVEKVVFAQLEPLV